MAKAALVSFPYLQNPEGQPFPIIPLRLEYANAGINTLALIDSGATISIFRSEVAKDLGINIEEGKEIYLGGVGGRIKGYIYKLTIVVANKKFIMPVVFSSEYLVSLNLLGRDSFFQKFLVTFDEKNSRVRLK